MALPYPHHEENDMMRSMHSMWSKMYRQHQRFFQQSEPGHYAILSWTDNAATEYSYLIQRCSNIGCSDFANLPIGALANAAGYTDSTLTAGFGYTYRVIAVGASGSSAPSILHQLALITSLSMQQD